MVALLAEGGDRNYVNYNSVSNANSNIGCRFLFDIIQPHIFTAQAAAHLTVKIGILGAG